MTEASKHHLDYSPPQNMEFAHFSIKRNGTLSPLDRNIAAEEIVATLTSTQKASILELPNNHEGLDMERLQASLDLFGAPPKPMLFLESADFTTALKQHGRVTSEPSGIYVEGLGMTLVKRDLALEALNGTALTESFAVHEGAHSTHIETPLRLLHSKHGFWRSPAIEISHSPRIYGVTPEDSLIPRLGDSFEEGYAELERGFYVEKHGLVEQFTHSADNLAQIARLPLPLHYMFKIHSNESEHTPTLSFAPGAIGATVFEILMKQDDKILPALRKSRHDSDGLRQTAELIDGVMPGLYTELQHANEQKMPIILKEVLKII